MDWATFWATFSKTHLVTLSCVEEALAAYVNIFLCVEWM
jgi:hypothetical protein